MEIAEQIRLMQETLREQIQLMQESAFLGCPPPLPRPQDAYFDGIHGFLRDMKERLAERSSEGEEE